MSESAYERGMSHGRYEEARGSRSSSGNFLTKSIGPLPMWGWMAVALLLALAYYMYRKNQSNAASNQTSTTADSQIPQFVNQTYTTVNPPPEPGPGGNPPPVDKDITVPNLVNKQQDQAMSELSKLGLKLKGQPPVKGKIRIITSQNPQAGTKVDKGAVITTKSRVK